MPLTLAHPAAVVPLRKTSLPFSALVVGSIAPDLEYLFHLSPTGQFGHTLSGLFLFCIPIGLLSLLIYHRIWLPPLNAFMHRRDSGFTFLPFSRLGIICLSLLIGAISHVAWDSFTHSYGWMVERVPILRMPLVETRWGTLKLFKLLQHASTVLGLTVVGAAMFSALRTLPAKVWRILAVLIITSLMSGFAIGIARTGIPSDIETVRVFTGVLIVSSLAVFTGEATLAGILWRTKKS
jgi:hypothetical protein